MTESRAGRSADTAVTPSPSLHEAFDKLGPIWVAILFALILSNLLWLVPNFVWSWWFETPGIINIKGFVSGHDFLAFWSAAKLALSGSATDAYDVPTIQAFQRAATGIEDFYDVPWHYPPSFLLVILPLGLLPYLMALAIWLVVPMPALVAAMSRIGLPPLAIWLVPLSPAVTQSLLAGQNGVLWALILTLALINLDQRPRLAGVWFGVLTVKPHLALVIGLALLSGRCWTTLFAMVASALALALFSLVAFGFEPWIAFVGHAAYPTQLLANGDVPWYRMPTVFASARLAGFGVTAAQGLQGAVAVFAVAGVAWMWWTRAAFSLRFSAMVAAIPLITPFAFDYDMVLLLLPVALMLKEGANTGWRRGEPTLLLIVWLMPVWWQSWFTAETSLSLAPVFFLLFFVAICRRAITREMSWRALVTGVSRHSPEAVATSKDRKLGL